MRISYKPKLPNGTAPAPTGIVKPKVGTQPIAGETPVIKKPTMKIKYTPTTPPPVKAPGSFLPGEPNGNATPKGPNPPRPGPKEPLPPAGPMKPPTKTPQPPAGPMKPPAPKPGDFGAQHRTHESLRERSTRLTERMNAGFGNKENLQKRIAKIQGREAAGKTKPQGYKGPKNKKGKGKVPPVQLDDKPKTWTPDKQAELAPARGYITQFKDVGDYTPNLKRKEMLRKQKREARNEMNGKKVPAPTNTNNFAPGEQAPGSTNTNNTDAAKKRFNKLKKKIARLNNDKNRPQPGTPKRPYRNRGVTYNPVGFGGNLRV